MFRVLQTPNASELHTQSVSLGGIGSMLNTPAKAEVRTTLIDCGWQVDSSGLGATRGTRVPAQHADTPTPSTVIDALMRDDELKFNTTPGYEDPLHNLPLNENVIHKFKNQSTKVRSRRGRPCTRVGGWTMNVHVRTFTCIHAHLHVHCGCACHRMRAVRRGPTRTEL